MYDAKCDICGAWAFKDEMSKSSLQCVRIGEACGSGDGHGALANDLCIMRPAGKQVGCAEETCEL